MKPILFTVMVLTSTAAFAAEFGQPAIAGAGCVAPANARVLKKISGKDRYAAPIQMNVVKGADAQIGRASCNMAIPVSLASGEKLVVRDVSQKAKFSVGPKTKAIANLEVFLAGDHSEVLKAEVEAKTATIKATRYLQAEEVVAESACGGSLIVRANSSVTVTGAGITSVKTDAALLSLSIETCDEPAGDSADLSN